MYAVSFRIPYEILGQRAYVNGSLHSPIPFNKGQPVVVSMKVYSSPSPEGLQAEVIESNRTQRPSSEFKWGLV